MASGFAQEMTPLDMAAYRTAMGHFATGVTVVTSTGAQGPAGLTTNAFSSLSLEPLLVLVCLDRTARTLAAVEASRRLAVNVLARDQEALAVTFAGKASHAEKFRGVSHREVDGVPVLEGVVAWLAGEVRELLPGGDHVIAVAEVTSFEAPGGEPLVFYGGRYGSIGS
jgi:flavin reductase (DIM6/NTAB) family NADH-FMN oxidoreductase RutF